MDGDQQKNTYDEVPEAPVAVSQPKQSLMVPAAIMLGFGLIAAAIFFSNNPGGSGSALDINNAINDANEPAAEVDSKPIRTVDENDHIRGNPNAPIVIVEYSDYDCPFCKNFHDTMNQVMDNYGTTGDVAWVYRHFPLEQLHPSAPYIAAASECVAKLAGNDAFWNFTDQIFNERSVNEPTNLTRLNEFAENAGADVAQFEACLENEETKAVVEEDFTDALGAGARGTPHSIIRVGGQEGVINGAQPYEVVSQIIDSLLTQTEQ